MRSVDVEELPVEPPRLGGKGHLRRLVRGFAFRLTDVLLLLVRPRLLVAYLRLWLLEYVRSPYGGPHGARTRRRIERAGQVDDELVYGETPLISALPLFSRAGVRRGSRVVDLGAGRGRALLAARWLGAAAAGVELSVERAAPASDIVRRVGIDLDLESFGDADPTHIYVVWTGLSAGSQRRLASKLTEVRTGTCVLTTTQPLDHEGFTTQWDTTAWYTWGRERVFCAIRR